VKSVRDAKETAGGERRNEIKKGLNQKKIGIKK
jgi:hypothetical protein